MIEKNLFICSIGAVLTYRIIPSFSVTFGRYPTAFLPKINRFKKDSIRFFNTMGSTELNYTTTTTNPHVAVVGSANYDLTVYTAQIPKMGETVMGNNFRTSCGGKGANQAIASACLGIGKTTIICRLGDDVFGQELLKNFQTSNVFVDVTTVPVSSGVACITVDTTTGDNSIIVAPGANFELTPKDVRERLLQLKPTVVLVQLEIPYESALEALKVGKLLGAITILNPAPAPLIASSLTDFYQYVDIIVPNESELRALCDSDSCINEEQMGKELLSRGIGSAVIVTLGARGALLVSRNDDSTISNTYCSAPESLPCKDEPIVDTIGAGDGFCGALASYLSTNLSDVPKAIQLACGFASMSIRRSGASYPKANEIPDCLRLSENHDQHAKKIKKTKPAITFVTGNKNKLAEVQRILSEGTEESFFELRSEKIDLPELQGNDTIEIAKEKCKLAAQQITGPCITEDTSLCFNALNGMPGPYIKWFLDNCGHSGLNMMLDGFNDRTAYAQTVVAYTDGPDSEVHTFEGKTDGIIVTARGPLDFGWDPIFEPIESNGLTYAEMTKDSKNSISHRGRAFSKLREFLKNDPQYTK
jgi:ribokinase/non-canonical purine NTP pyrophosphatase (RdgB/HAM1 family)